MSSRKAPRKNDAERGPLGAWAYGTRTLLDVATGEAAQAAGVTEPTLRKIEGGSTRQPARRVVWGQVRGAWTLPGYPGINEYASMMTPRLSRGIAAT